MSEDTMTLETPAEVDKAAVIEAAIETAVKHHEAQQAVDKAYEAMYDAAVELEQVCTFEERKDVYRQFGERVGYSEEQIEQTLQDLEELHKATQRLLNQLTGKSATNADGAVIHGPTI